MLLYLLVDGEEPSHGEILFDFIILFIILLEPIDFEHLKRRKN